MAKRKQLTLPRAEFYEPIKHLEPDVKHAVLDIIFDFFFEDKGIFYPNLDPSVRSAVACLMPNLRRVQAQFDNGKSEKKSRQNSQGLLCPLESSQAEPNKAKQIKVESSFLNNNIYNNIYNNQIISNQEEKNKKEELAQSDPDKKEWFADAVLQQLERIKEVDEQVNQKMQQIVHVIAQRNEPYKIKNELIMPETVLEQFLEFFRTDDIQLIIERFNNIISRTREIKTTNRLNYLVVSLFNESKFNL